MSLYDAFAAMSRKMVGVEHSPEVGSRSLFNIFKEVHMKNYLMLWMENGVHQLQGISLLDSDLDSVVIDNTTIEFHPLIAKIEEKLGFKVNLHDGVSFDSVEYVDDSFIRID